MVTAFKIKRKSEFESQFHSFTPLLPSHVCISLFMDDMVASESVAPISPRPPLLTFC